MKREICCFIILILTFSTVLSGAGTDLPNPGFEQKDHNNQPVSWRTADGMRNIILTTQSENIHSGESALRINHADWDQTTILSDIIELKVGHLYKLSGWIKTENAFSDPLDRYPTSVAACLTMASMPFTNHSPAVGNTTDWKYIETQFLATQKEDRVHLHLGFNGRAKGTAIFDDIQVEKIGDITSFIPLETVRWCDKGFRYDDRGWIFIHIEGKPYKRGFQYGYLLAEEIVQYMSKLAIEINKEHPEDGWRTLRFSADALMLRKYEAEYLEEMQGIADGAAEAGAVFEGNRLNLVDIVTINSITDLESATWGGLSKEAHALSGKSFLSDQDEMDIPGRTHKCSGFLANGPATRDGRIVFGQMFMWSGYTGPHWNVICDVVPTNGYRLVYETFPGGIHSGADFYINSTGMMIGETTTRQTPYDLDGTPQSNRIRKAAQYASNIDEAVKILWKRNNGMYTNNWLIGDTKTDEIAIYLLGTRKSKLWRSKTKFFPGGTDGFYWSNNNNMSPDVRKEYITNPENAPVDILFQPWNRDIAFNQFYKKMKGKIDAVAGVNLWASSPINRPHACDGKIMTSEMAEELVFLAHSGKTTLREKFIGENGRIPDLPGATPRLTLGYSTASPIFVADKLKALRSETLNKKDQLTKDLVLPDDSERHHYKKRQLWHNTVYNKNEADKWFVAATSAYWLLMNQMSDEKNAYVFINEKLAELNYELLYVMRKEGTLVPMSATEVYDQYKHYKIPRARGIYLLHQLRLHLGNDGFSLVMNAVHQQYREKPMSTRQFIQTAERISGRSLESFIMQWLQRDDLPELTFSASHKHVDDRWECTLEVNQVNAPYHFLGIISIETENRILIKNVEIKNAKENFSYILDEKPVQIHFNSGYDVPVKQNDCFTMYSYYQDWYSTKIVYGTSRQIEANHTLGLRFSKVLADRYSETLPPVVKDYEITLADFAQSDIILLGGSEDNGWVKTLAEKCSLTVGKNYFQWHGKTYGQSDEGLFAVFANPYNPKRSVYFFIANSAMQLYHMTNQYYRNPAWAIFKNGAVIEKGYHQAETMNIDM